MQIFALSLWVCIAKFALAEASCKSDDKRPAMFGPTISPGRGVVINEIFADPGGNSLLPTQEFVEIWNSTSDTIFMKGWKFSDARSTVLLKADTLAPGTFLLLCARADTMALQAFGKTQGLSPWPGLNNDEDLLTLTDAQGLIADQVHYKPDFYRGVTSKGLSLERIGVTGNCQGIQNWAPGNSPARITPGGQNSRFDSHSRNEQLRVRSAVLAGDSSLRLSLSGEPDTATALRPESYLLNNGAGMPVQVLFEQGSFSTLRLRFPQQLVRNREYTLKTPGVRDCAGRPVVAEGEFNIFIPDTVAAGDLLISELLSNPRLGGVDFVELYNASNKILDLSGLHVARADSTGKPADARPLSEETLLMEPETYRAFSTSTQILLNQYALALPRTLTQVSRLPAYNNDRGSVVLLSGPRIIDRLDYHEGMHHPLLKHTKGVSLERGDLRRPANDRGNFGSAAAAPEHATPGYRNSRQLDHANGNSLVLEITTFSPDGDGNADILPIRYGLDAADCLATVTVYSDRGMKVRVLLRNEIAGNSGTLSWDGNDESGHPCAAGIYLIHFSAFSTSGSSFSSQKTCVLARSLN
ncbi:lamin tail domain-containing protein [Pedobacter sp. SYP-B3415]|uniref:lamin tail domain-containing protein n=1 Tax=Pedobacter sp. SYP-B3415 TaxID=2496641 RepID=UPI0013ED8E57|nr:lamin tail domain-containing protein [Pedobacter sp. SYP-B3415]